jgi:hypothetical protein
MVAARARQLREYIAYRMRRVRRYQCGLDCGCRGDTRLDPATRSEAQIIGGSHVQWIRHREPETSLGQRQRHHAQSRGKTAVEQLQRRRVRL